MTQQVHHNIDQHNAEYWEVIRYNNHPQRTVASGPVSDLCKAAPHDCDVPGCPGPVNKRKLEAFEELRQALKMVLPHLEELEDAWRRGAFSEHDGMGGLRSNRNVDCARQVRAAIAKTEGV